MVADSEVYKIRRLKMEIWNGFKLEKSIFEGRELISVFPEKPNGKWALKTEYFDAFPG